MHYPLQAAQPEHLCYPAAENNLRIPEPNKGMKGEQIRSMDDYALDFTKLKELAKNDKIEKIRFYTEIDKIKNELNGEKFEEMSL